MSQTLTTVDTTAPVLSGQGADADVECPDPLEFTAPTASDDCDQDPEITFADTTTTDNCGLETTTRTWTATDCSGNASATVSQTLTTVDTTAPVLSGQGADADVECPDPLEFTAPTASDDCDQDPEITFADTTTTDNCGLETTTRTWTATDCSGNASATVSQTLTTVDTTAPVLSGQGADADVECPDPLEFTAPTASDDCDQDPEITFADTTTTDNCGLETTTRTWTATDCSGNASATVSQTLTTVDTTAPVLSGQGADADVECPDPLEFTAPTASDDCDQDPEITFADTTTTDNCGLETTTRTWTATDCSGNASATVSQTLTTVDTTAPVLSGQGADADVECPDPLEFTAPTASDDCDQDPEITFADTTTTDNCGLETTTRTWTATDCSGNASATVSQTLTTVDTTAPVLSGQGADADVECPDPLEFTAPTASDDCDQDPEITFADTTTTDNCGLETTTRTWTATDCSGNASATVSQTLTTVDTTAPVLSGQGADADVECPDPLEFTAPTASDDCDQDPEITFADTTTTDNCGLETTTRTWTATDCSGNASATVSQTLTTVDTTAPVLSGQGADADVECPDPLEFTAPTASDDCDQDPEITFADTTTTDNCGLETTTRTWTATDCSGNASATVSQTLTTVDTTAPVLSGQGADADVECPDPLEFTAPTASDDCDQDPEITFADTTTTDNCGLETTTRTWTATDCSGNASATVSQTLTTVDTTAPVLSGQGADADVECPDPLEFTAPTASDDCDQDPEITFADTTTTDNCGLETTTRTWTATDCSGNASATVSQTLTTVDTTAPVLSGQGADADVECPDPLEFTAPTASDDCDQDPEITFADTTTTDNCGLETTTRTWTATDCSGNASATVSQTLTTVDTTAPVLSGQGADADVECPDPLEFTAPTASDDCDQDPEITFADTTTTDNCGLETTTRTWTATDCSGNASATVSQTLTTVDTTAPVLSGQGADADVECPDPLEFTAPTASDDCDQDPEITFADTTTTDNCGLETTTRTWTATDCSGNASATVSQTLTTVDTTAPVLSGQGADADVECPDPLEFTAPTASDDCDQDPEITFADTTTTDNCGLETTTRTWTATDCSGNASATVSQTLTTVDTTAPVLDAEPADITYECIDEVPAPGLLGYVDACEGSGSVLGVDVSDNGSCPEIITRTWTVTDCSGNTSSVSQTITVNDTIDPEIVNLPVIDPLCNDEFPAILYADWTDNCAAGGTISATPIITNDGCQEIAEYIFYVEDDCGNSDTETVFVFREFDLYENCTTSYGRLVGSDTCFNDDGFNQWGWTNNILEEGVYTMELWAGAAQCNTGNGVQSGEVIVTYDNGLVDVEFQLFPGFVMNVAHVYIGCDKYPIGPNGQQTVAPGQYNFQLGDLDYVTNYTLEDVEVDGPFWIIVHAVTCEETCRCSISEDEGGSQDLPGSIECSESECVDNAICSIPIPDNSVCNPPSSFDYRTKRNGSWTSRRTWVGGNVPPTEDISNKDIKVGHHVYIPNANVKLKDGSILYVVGANSSLTLENGNLLLEGANTKAIFEDTILRTSANMEQKENTFVCMTNVELWIGEEESGPDFVPGESSTSANFKNDGGYRWLENVCGNITHDLQNLGTDFIIDSCIDIGDQGNVDKELDGQDSGNFQNEKGVMKIWNTEFYIANGDFQNSTALYICGVDYRLTNGNFQNNSGDGLIEGEDLVIWINHNSNGDIQNESVWDGSTITLWRLDNGHSPQGINNLPGEATSESISGCFGCDCTFNEPVRILSESEFPWNIDFTVSPVPFDGELFVSYNFDYDTSVEIQIFDFAGRLLKHATTSYNKGADQISRFDLRGTNDQVFFVKLITKKGIGMKKAVAANSREKNRR